MIPLIVGLTGGIGSGKTTVCEAFSRLGIPVINADHVAKDVVSIGQPALQELATQFGPAILNEDASLNRDELRRLIFSDPGKKSYVEELLHPLILQQIKQQIEKVVGPYVIIEIPLLIEAGWQKLVDQTLVIDLPEGLQIERTEQRSGLDKNSIEQIMQTQLSRNERVKHADQLIDNSGDANALSSQIATLHQQYLRLSEMRQP